MNDTLTSLTDTIRDQFLALLWAESTDRYDAAAKVAVGWGGDVGRDIMCMAISAGLLVVDPRDEQDTLDACWKIADEVKGILLFCLPADRIAAAREALR